jgi:hydrogenase maturation protease
VSSDTQAQSTPTEPAFPAARILIAGIGNIFLRDDGFGPEVARCLAADPANTQPGVRIVDYGIRGMHLAYDLLDGVEALILVDAIPAAPPSTASPQASTGGGPGSIRVMQVESRDVENAAAAPALDPHGMDPMTVLARLRTLGGVLPATYVVGCVPADTGEGIGLSDVVAQAIPEAAAGVRALVARHMQSSSHEGGQ